MLGHALLRKYMYVRSRISATSNTVDKYIDLARAKSEASVYVLVMKAIKFELASSKPLEQIFKSLFNFRNLRHNFTSKGGG